MKINLNRCKKGDVLISKHNVSFIYSHKDTARLHPHIIFDALTETRKFSRRTNGKVFKNMSLESDNDIVKIISI